eukprot:TRINITY_DN456_c0_g2_i1.p2 TRINITY_DN456_c0_g2~~TRINITY_DN456_c0_g2_i1.p2  ORF type:complete len:412 (+),score=24.64 TRINITY_DN456_c0_g2_i1:267-1502(+)
MMSIKVLLHLQHLESIYTHGFKRKSCIVLIHKFITKFSFAQNNRKYSEYSIFIPKQQGMQINKHMQELGLNELYRAMKEARMYYQKAGRYLPAKVVEKLEGEWIVLNAELLVKGLPNAILANGYGIPKIMSLAVLEQHGFKKIWKVDDEDWLNNMANSLMTDEQKKVAVYYKEDASKMDNLIVEYSKWQAPEKIDPELLEQIKARTEKPAASIKKKMAKYKRRAAIKNAVFILNKCEPPICSICNNKGTTTIVLECCKMPICRGCAAGWLKFQGKGCFACTDGKGTATLATNYLQVLNLKGKEVNALDKEAVEFIKKRRGIPEPERKQEEEKLMERVNEKKDEKPEITEEDLLMVLEKHLKNIGTGKKQISHNSIINKCFGIFEPQAFGNQKCLALGALDSSQFQPCFVLY